MFEALLSRGALVKDYLLASLKSRDEFVELVSRAFREDKAVFYFLFNTLAGKGNF